MNIDLTVPNISPQPTPRPPQPPRQLNILLHDRDALGVDGAQIGVLKQVHEKRLGGLLQRHDGLALPAELVRAARQDVVGDLAHQPREGQLEEQQVRRLLVPPDLAQCYCAGFEAVGFLLRAGVAGWEVAF